MTTLAADATQLPRTCLPPPARLAEHLREVDEQGYTVIPGFLDLGTTARLREHADALLATRSPKGEVQSLRHPIPGQIMAEVVTEGHLELARALLGATELRLLEQVVNRTIPAPIGTAPGARGWHIDWGFYPRHLAARPRQTYHHLLHLLTDVEPGRAATMVVPGSHRLTAAAAEELSRRGERFPMLQQDELKAEIVRLAGIDTTRGVEVIGGEGDLLVFDPMCLHSASVNVRQQPRYVMFQSYCDVSAVDLNAGLEARNYRSNFPDSLREGLPERLRSLLNR